VSSLRAVRRAGRTAAQRRLGLTDSRTATGLKLNAQRGGDLAAFNLAIVVALSN
jgi:hypothetical protein